MKISSQTSKLIDSLVYSPVDNSQSLFGSLITDNIFSFPCSSVGMQSMTLCVTERRAFLNEFPRRPWELVQHPFFIDELLCLEVNEILGKFCGLTRQYKNGAVLAQCLLRVNNNG